MLSTVEDKEHVERMLDFINPDMQPKPKKEGTESDLFWNALGGKRDYSSQKVVKNISKYPQLFACFFSKGTLMGFTGSLEVREISNFTQDDLMTKDVMVLDYHSKIYVLVGQDVGSKSKQQEINIGKKFVEKDILLENLSFETHIFVISEGIEPPFYTRFFSWDSSKSTMHGNSFQRKLSIMKIGVSPIVEKPKRHSTASHGGRRSMPDRSHISSRSTSFSPDLVHVRGRSPAFNALASTLESLNGRNISTPPPIIRKSYPKSLTLEALNKTVPPRSQEIASLKYVFERMR